MFENTFVFKCERLLDCIFPIYEGGVPLDSGISVQHCAISKQRFVILQKQPASFKLAPISVFKSC